MRIGIDARNLVKGRITGVGRWTYNLVRHLLGLDRENEYILLRYPFVFGGIDSNFQARNRPGLHTRICMFPNRVLHRLWDRFDFPSTELLVGKVDIFHAHFVAPPYNKGKSIVMIHDLSFLKFPEYHTRFAELFKRNVRRSVKTADMIIANSYYTKKDICEILGVPEDKIRVMYGGVNDTFHPVKDQGQIKKLLIKYKIRERYILNIGTLEPRKNIVRLIEAFSQLKRNYAIEHKLVLAGPKGWQYNEVFKKITELKLEKEVIFTGYLTDRDLSLLLSGTEVFIYPSLYEGFGFPPLEAMACGAPVIVSGVSSLPEVVGNAAIYINPYEVNEIAEAIFKVINDEKLRQVLKERGFQRVNFFSWDKTARETLAIYKEIL